MQSRLGGRLRVVSAAGTLLAVAGLVTAAALTDETRVAVQLDGTANTFDIVVASGEASGWVPSSSDWAQGNPGHHSIILENGGDRISPGGRISIRIAAMNNSPRNDGILSLSIIDPVPRGDARDPDTGRYLELFDQLVFTVREGGTTIFDHVLAADLSTYTWPTQVTPGEVHLLEVEIELPGTVDNRWQKATTDVQFAFVAVSS